MGEPRLTQSGSSAATWWRNAVIYQIYPRSFADGTGDGIGDLVGIRSRLPYVHDLGVDTIWISPFYRSPQADGGYDVADYLDVDPIFGTLTEVEALIRDAHALGLRVIVDVVPNHTSDEHRWFRDALAAAPGSRERSRYWFVDSQTLPNNWPSDFGGPAWTRVPDGQWYLHLFDRKQPDLNWTNPDVRAMFLDVLRFWLDRGVDGFRVDVANALVKADGLPDFRGDFEAVLSGEVPTNTVPFYDQDGVHEIWREWRALLDGYPGDRAMVAEAWVTPAERLALYVRHDEFHQAFNFPYLQTPWVAADLREAIGESLRTVADVGAPATWVLANHDVVRLASRLGLANATRRGSPWLSSGESPPDLGLGLRRARAAVTLMLALPGSAGLYQGEELGLPEVIDLPGHARRDPTFERTDGALLGRDGCRVPMPWKKDAPAFGFSPSGASWLPQPSEFAELAVDQQSGQPESTLELYRALLRLRRQREVGTGTLTLVDLSDHIVAADIATTIGTTRVVLNLGTEPWPIPAASELLVHSTVGEVAPTWRPANDELATDCAIWVTGA